MYPGKKAWEDWQTGICQLKVVAIETGFNIFYEKNEHVMLSLQSFPFEHKMWKTQLWRRM